MLKPEGSIEDEVREIVSRPLLALASKKDVGRLLRRIRVLSVSSQTGKVDVLFDGVEGSERAQQSRQEQLYSFLAILLRKIGSTAELEKCRAFIETREVFSQDMSLLTQLFEMLEERSPLSRLLACVNQNAISPAVVRVKYETSSRQIRTRDLKQWTVDIMLYEDDNAQWTVEHRRGESQIDGDLVIRWCLRIQSDMSCSLRIFDYVGTDEALYSALRPFMAPNVLCSRRPLNLVSANLVDIPEHCLPLLVPRVGPALTQLHLSCNQLSTLPDAFSEYLVDLVTLDLTQNNFQKIPRCIFWLKNLEDLRIGMNKIKTLAGCQFDAMRQLHSFDCSYNQLTTWLCEMPPSLTFLSIHNNLLSEFPASELSKLHRLETLKAHNNPFLKLDVSLGLSEKQAESMSAAEVQQLLLETLMGHNEGK